MASSSDLVVVTGASGLQCRYLLQRLYGKYPLRLAGKSDEGVAALRAKYPDADVRQVDLNEAAQCRELVRDAVVVYHVGPSFHPHETNIGHNMIDACERELTHGAKKFRHFVYSSVHTTQLRKLMNHDNKRYVEEYLYESSLNYTVLKPSDFINFGLPVKALLSADPATSTVGGRQPDGSILYRPPWSQDTKSSFMHLGDLAEATAKVIAEREKHFQAEYSLCSTSPLSRRELGAAMEQITGIKVTVVDPGSQQQSVSNLLQRMYGGDSDPRIRDGAERLILFYWRRGLVGNPNVLRWLLGREPTSHLDWIRSEAAQADQ